MLLQLRTVLLGSSMLATVISSPTAAASVVAARLRDVRKGGGVTTRARLPSELVPVVPVLQLRFGAFSLSLSLSLSRSISTFRSHTLRITEGDAYADNRAALRQERDY